MASIVKKSNGYEVGCRCGWRQNASTPELATTLRDGHLCEIDKLTAVVVIAREMAQADCACGECFACRFREALDSVVVKDDGDPAQEALLTEIRRVTSERNAAVHNETETALLLAEAREHIAKLESERIVRTIHKHADEPGECGGVQFVHADGRTSGCAMEFDDVSEMYAKASYDAQLMLRDVESERAEFRAALDGLLTAFLYEASQGDGVAEEFVPRVEAAKALLARAKA